MEGGSAADGALDGLAQLQEMLKGSRAATPEQRAAGPPPAMMEMMRMMASQREQPPPPRAPAAGGHTFAPAAAAPAVTPAPAVAPPASDQPAVPAPAVPLPEPAAPAGPPRWRAQTTWEMGDEDGSGLRLVICEDDATEEAEIAEGRLEGQTTPRLTTLRPAASETPGVAAVPPCDLLLEAVPAAAIVRATVIRYRPNDRRLPTLCLFLRSVSSHFPHNHITERSKQPVAHQHVRQASLTHGSCLLAGWLAQHGWQHRGVPDRPERRPGDIPPSV